MAEAGDTLRYTIVFYTRYLSATILLTEHSRFDHLSTWSVTSTGQRPAIRLTVWLDGSIAPLGA